MKIAVAQIRPEAGNIAANIAGHIRLASLAAAQGARVIVFPELSITGYEPKLVAKLALTAADPLLAPLRATSDQHNITICVGAPTPAGTGLRISMLIFQPGQPPLTYSKQHVHADELPHFIDGTDQVVVRVSNETIAPAICYESLLPAHAENAGELGATIYMTSVAKSANGVAKAYKHYPEIAKRHNMAVVMANCIGPCDDFIAVGQSAAWSPEGTLIQQLDSTSEGLLIYDTVNTFSDIVMLPASIV